MTHDADNQIAPYLDSGPLRIFARVGTGPYLLVIFSGVGKKHTGWQPIEFVKFAKENPQNHVLFVVDGSRSWLNGPHLIEQIEAAVATYRAAQPVERVVVMGNSMGGFMALAMAQRLNAHSSIAFSPQFSVHPGIVPLEQRWTQLRRRIDTWRIKDLSNCMTNRTQHTIVHGAFLEEVRHWMNMPMGPKINHFLFPDHTHYVVRYLRETGVLHPLIEQAIAGRPRRVRQLAESIGGMKRKHYIEAMTHSQSHAA